MQGCLAKTGELADVCVKWLLCYQKVSTAPSLSSVNNRNVFMLCVAGWMRCAWREPVHAAAAG